MGLKWPFATRWQVVRRYIHMKRLYCAQTLQANLKRAVGQRTDLIAFAPVKVKQVLVELAEEADSLGLFQLS